MDEQSASQSVSSSPARLLARLSWVAFLVFFAANFVGRATGLLVPAELVGLLVLCLGCVCGVAALFFVRSNGKKGILVPAIVGLVLCGAFVIVWITNFLSTLARVQAQ